MRTILQLIFSEVWKEILKPLFRFLVTSVGKDLWDITKLSVTGVEVDYPDLTGPEKFKIVFERVKSTMEAQGRTYRTSTYNLFIELAVAYVKKKLGG